MYAGLGVCAFAGALSPLAVAVATAAAAAAGAAGVAGVVVVPSDMM